MQQLTIPGVVESLSAVSAFVTEATATAGLDSKATYRLRLAVIELVTNTILHGYAEAGLSGSIELKAEMDDRQLKIVLEDTAIPYDPMKTPPPDDLDAPIEDRHVGGLGVFLVLQEVDSFRYARVGNRNRSEVVITRPSPSPAM